MGGSIRISPKHGLNPSIPLCFWCGKEKNEVVLMGKINKEDFEAPRNVFLDYEPCNECAAKFAKGIHVVGVLTEDNGNPPLKGNDGESYYPTGASFVASENFIKRLIADTEEQDKILKKRSVLMDSSVVEQILKDLEDASEAAS